MGFHKDVLSIIDVIIKLIHRVNELNFKHCHRGCYTDVFPIIDYDKELIGQKHELSCNHMLIVEIHEYSIDINLALELEITHFYSKDDNKTIASNCPQNNICHLKIVFDTTAE